MNLLNLVTKFAHSLQNNFSYEKLKLKNKPDMTTFFFLKISDARNFVDLHTGAAYVITKIFQHETLSDFI